VRTLQEIASTEQIRARIRARSNIAGASGKADHGANQSSVVLARVASLGARACCASQKEAQERSAACRDVLIKLKHFIFPLRIYITELKHLIFLNRGSKWYE
jgi:hypothetical protein